MDSSYLKPLRARVSLASQIQKIMSQQDKVKKTASWFSRSAKALDIQLDDDLYPSKSSFMGGVRWV